MSETERERLERLILKEFRGVAAIDGSHLATLRPFKTGDFMPSLLGLMLYCNGHSLRGTSRTNPNGLIYADDTTLFGIGVFRKTIASPDWHVMISGPWSRGHGGRDTSIATVDRFIHRLRTLGVRHETYVRHLDQESYDRFRARGYVPIDARPWDPVAPSEDETYSHSRIYLPDIIGPPPQYEIQTLRGGGNRGHRVKARLSFNRFSNFLDRNNLALVVRDYTRANRSTAELLVRHHFNVLKNPVGSTPEDYLALIEFDPEQGGDQYFGKMGFLESAGGGSGVPQPPTPILLFLGEKTNTTTVALYATFANRHSAVLDSCVDPTGFSAISQFAYLLLFRSLREHGIDWVDVGGSETLSLDTFKRQLGATQRVTRWVVAPPDLHPGEPTSDELKSASNSA